MQLVAGCSRTVHTAFAARINSSTRALLARMVPCRTALESLRPRGLAGERCVLPRDLRMNLSNRFPTRRNKPPGSDVVLHLLGLRLKATRLKRVWTPPALHTLRQVAQGQTSSKQAPRDVLPQASNCSSGRGRWQNPDHSAGSCPH